MKNKEEIIKLCKRNINAINGYIHSSQLKDDGHQYEFELIKDFKKIIELVSGGR